MRWSEIVAPLLMLGYLVVLLVAVVAGLVS